LLALRSGKWQLPTLSTVQTAVSNISKVESNIQASQKEASAKKIDTADLASKAAGHIDRCSSVHTQVSDAQTQTRALLDTTERHIVRAQQQIEENLKLSADMASEATSRDEQAEGNNLVYTEPTTDIYLHVGTQMDPVLTVPAALLDYFLDSGGEYHHHPHRPDHGKVCFRPASFLPSRNHPLIQNTNREHRHQAAACRDMVTKLNAEVKEKSAEKLELETTSSQLNGALSDLKVAGAEAQQTAKQASKLQDQAKALTDQYGLITTRVRDVLRGLGHVRHDVSAELWDETRFNALLALRGMLTTLKERGLLSPKSLLVAGIAENVHVPVVQGPGLLDDL
jgi:hypothetical protein